TWIQTLSRYGDTTALHQVAPHEAGIAQHHIKAKRNGVEFPALGETIAEVGFECEAQDHDHPVKDQKLEQPNEHRFLNSMFAVPPSGIGKEERSARPQTDQDANKPRHR